MSAPEAWDERVLVFAPTGRDGRLIGDVLFQAGVRAESYNDLTAVSQQIDMGAGAVVLSAEEALASPAASMQSIVQALAAQPAWADLPIIVLTLAGVTTDRILESLASPGTVITLERPVAMSTLVSAVRTALQTRRRQYDVRNLLERLRETDRLKDEFLAMLAHELRNPLSPIMNAAEMMKLRPGDKNVVERQRAIIERQANHLAHLLNDLLDVSRVTQGKILLVKGRVLLADVVQQAVESADALIQSRGHALVVNLPEQPVWLDADASRLQQILVNLLNNAAKYTEPNGRIVLAAALDGRDVTISVEDNGIGITADVLPRVFDLFVQSQRALDRSQGGLGIGLTMVRRLAEMHGGTVDAKSGGPGTGSTFTVRLPVLQPGDSTADGAAAEHGFTATNHHILLVEDSVDAAETMADLLRVWGNEVTVAHEGSAALEAARERPDVVLLDIGLPGMDGYEVARRMRGMPEMVSATLIAMTGYGQDDDRCRAREAGFNHHLTKPVDLNALQQLLL